MVEPDHLGKSDSGAEDDRDRRTANIVLLIFFAVIVGSGLWLASAMIKHKTLEDCMAQGRRNCAPIETPVR